MHRQDKHAVSSNSSKTHSQQQCLICHLTIPEHRAHSNDPQPSMTKTKSKIVGKMPDSTTPATTPQTTPKKSQGDDDDTDTDKPGTPYKEAKSVRCPIPGCKATK